MSAGPVSVVYGAVRVALADGWDAAREALRVSILACYGQFRLLPEGDVYCQGELARVEGDLVASDVTDGQFLVTSWPRCPVRYAVTGIAGLAAGDLACLYDYSNRCRDWTIHVKVKIVQVGQAQATVRVTGNCLQLGRHEVLAVPLTKLQCRGHGTPGGVRYCRPARP